MLPLPISLTDLQIDEVLRYMGTPPDRAEPAIRKLAEGCARELLGVVRPRWAARTFELTPEEGGVRLSSGLLLPGEDLKRHLAGCRRAVLFCATLSAQADALIRRAESGDMLRALALDSCATAAVEQDVYKRQGSNGAVKNAVGAGHWPAHFLFSEQFRSTHPRLAPSATACLLYTSRCV